LSTGTMPDVLFTDIVMPGGLSGWELADRARALQPALRVLLTSGYPMETMAMHDQQHVERFILNKPYRKAELARRLRALLNGPS
jgi:CheY-like chemotaxis protein